MTTRFSFEVQLGSSVRARSHPASGPLRVLVLGDFSGNAKTEPGRNAAPVKIDIDNFDTVMQRLGPVAAVDLNALGAGELTLAFASLDDFHPDRLYRDLEIVTELRESRERLANPASYAAEAARLLGDSPLQKEPVDDKASEDDATTVSRLLGGQPAAQDLSRALPLRKDLQQIVHDIVAPHIEAGVGEEQGPLIASVDQAVGEYIRGVLHAPAFQRLEAAWRALHWLVFENEAGELEVTLLDIDKPAIQDDFAAAGGQLQNTQLYRRLVTDNEGPGTHGYSLIIGDYAFDASEADVDLLAGLGLLAAHAGAPFVASADQALSGCDDLEHQPDRDAWRDLDEAAQQRWLTLRGSPAAAWIGLAAPRIVGRLPYGKGTDPTDAFDFTELTPNPDHAAFLWVNPAFACAQLIAAAFGEDGWSMQPGSVLDLADLPLALYELAGGSAIKPCAEVCLSESSAQALLDRGVMAFMSYRDRNAVRLAGFRSIATPPQPLAGPWQT